MSFSRSTGFILSIVAASLLFVPQESHAQISGLSPEQQRLLSQLPASQRQALIERFTGGTRADAPQEPNDDDEEEDGSPADVDAMPIDELVREPRFEVGDTVVLMPIVATEFQSSDGAAELRDNVAADNPYVVQPDGKIYVAGVAGIGVAGLTEDQARIRMEADNALRFIDVEVFLLPVVDLSGRDLKPYGYDLFRSRIGKGIKDANLPVPSNYIVGPGDSVRVQLYGGDNVQYDLTIDRDGVLNFPELGPINVSGLSFDSMRKDIEQRVVEQMIGTQVSVTMGQLRSVQVILVGDVDKPGSYNVSALSSITDVLFRAGGISENGSLRRVELKRNGQTITTLDLYELLLKGNSSRNRRVSSGDVIFVPPVGKRITVTGSIKRPATYELRGESKVSQALQIAGGANADAYLAGARIERSVPSKGLAVIDVDLSTAAGRGVGIADGDVLVVPGQTDQVDNAVTVMGNVFRPGVFQWSSGLKVSDLLRSSRDLKPQSDPNYVVIRREQTENGVIEVLSVDLAAVWERRSGVRNPDLRMRDQVIVFSLNEGRDQYLKPIIEELKLQGNSERPSPLVRVGGRVKIPGEYPLEAGMNIADLIRAGGGLDESAYRDEAELTRYSIGDGASRHTKLLDVRLDAAIAGELGANIGLNPFDYLNVKEISRWREDDLVEIRGEVAFPGIYPVFQGETMTSVLERAGGLTDFAFPQGSVFTREVLKVREREQLDVLASRIEGDLASLALSDPGQTEAISIGQSLLRQIKNTEPAGRLVIDLANVLDQNRGSDILLRDGDVLFVPSKTQEVTVLGEVQYATSHLWEAGLDRDDYIDRSGGTTVKADKRRIYVVRANGEVVVSSRSRFFSKSRAFDIRVGDTVVVPLDTDRVKPLVLWSSATQILYNLAIAAAAVNSF